MDKSEVVRIVDENIERLTKQLVIDDWKIGWVYGKCDTEGWAAQCLVHPEYKQAVITIDPSQVETEFEMLQSLRHELIHISLSEFDVYRRFVCCNIDSESPMDAAEDYQWKVAIERCVLAVERILDGGASAKQI